MAHGLAARRRFAGGRQLRTAVLAASVALATPWEPTALCVVCKASAAFGHTWPPSCRRRLRPYGGHQAALQALAGGAAVEQQDVPRTLYIARTKIKLRIEADVSSQPTGGSLKAGEVFKVTEAVVPAEPGGMTYLRVGDRGWVFDRGVAGSWLNKPIVELVPEAQRPTYERLLDDPQSYREYRKIMDDPDYLKRIADIFKARALEAKNADPGSAEGMDGWEEMLSSPDKLNKFKEMFGSAENLAVWEGDTENIPLAKEEPQKDKTERVKMATSIADRLQEDPEWKEWFDRMKQFRQQSPKGRVGRPTTVVAPRWMKLKGVEMNTEVDEDGKPKRPQVVRELPGGPEALRARPGCTGWRLGLRVPSVSCLM